MEVSMQVIKTGQMCKITTRRQVAGIVDKLIVIGEFVGISSPPVDDEDCEEIGFSEEEIAKSNLSDLSTVRKFVEDNPYLVVEKSDGTLQLVCADLVSKVEVVD